MTTRTWMAMTLTLLALSQIRSVGTVGAEEAAEESEKALFRRGAELWPKVCANCHNPRPGSERSPAEWDTIIMHMRSIANLPEKDARAIQVFLKAR
jgi:mono/diheme cytochrome c family protein